MPWYSAQGILWRDSTGGTGHQYDFEAADAADAQHKLEKYKRIVETWDESPRFEVRVAFIMEKVDPLTFLPLPTAAAA